MKEKWQSDVIALTGGIGSGKSTALKLFEQLGAFVLSADSLARDAVAPGTLAYDQICDFFGREILHSDASLNREKLAKLVFDNPEKRKRLEAITHPSIRQLAQKNFKAAMQERFPLYIYEIPLLFEAGLEDSGFKAIVLIKAAPAIARSRAASRDALSDAQVERRMAAQLPDAVKESKSSIIIQNDGTLDELKAQVTAAFEKLKTL